MKKGYGFVPTTDYITYTMNFSAKDKLTWLEEANEFVRKFVSKEKLEIWEKIRRGEY